MHCPTRMQPACVATCMHAGSPACLPAWWCMWPGGRYSEEYLTALYAELRARRGEPLPLPPGINPQAFDMYPEYKRGACMALDGRVI